MIFITNGVLDVESAKKEFYERDLTPFQIYKEEEDGSLYPVDHQDVQGMIVDFCIDQSKVVFEYESILYGISKVVHRFENHNQEVLIHVKGEQITAEINNIQQQLCS